MTIKQIMNMDLKRIISIFSHDDIDDFCREELKHRPYKLGESKINKINKIRLYLKEGGFVE